MEKEKLLQTLSKQGITEETIQAIAKVPRELFIGNNTPETAYKNIALPIDYDQTISQPYTVAYMIDLLELSPGKKVLELGGGTGYSAAVMWEKMKRQGELYSLELIPGLQKTGKQNLAKAGYKEIHLICKDGKKGYPEHAPYDRVVIAAAVSTLAKEITEQLKEEGILVFPQQTSQNACIMTKIKKKKQGFETSTHGYFAFVPFV
ncbi:protein-L-isoaspartate(D-aspartate) O-methyltransferase [Spirochaetia bacterium 38H-sp]|uniref:Protein-L-isoaspartate O-methyltransferase n=1 Tax=Rarispira pelagica TaxID=3141764 RepID=A0ABU9UCS7_9SPIR